MARIRLAGMGVYAVAVAVALVCLLLGSCIAGAAPPDAWQVIVPNSGVVAMHATLTYTNKVIIFDRTDFGASQIKLPNGYCRRNPRDHALKVDCTAHSVELDLATNTVRALNIFSDTWCSSGSFRADGTLLQTGGWNDGGNVVRTIGVGSTDDWKEFPGSLAANRWYASNHILPDNRVIVVGGRRAFSYEFYPKAKGETLTNLPFLYKTTDPGGVENNLYPFVHLNTDGNLFIFGNQDSILLNYKTNTVVKTYPRIPGGPRNYPSSGAAVLLPLTYADGFKAAEVMICGGCPPGAYVNVGKGKFDTALQTCGRMVITAAAPKWTMENMPMPRVMNDMLILPTGEILIINGAQAGTAGYGSARQPNLSPVLYNPGTRRYQTMRASTIPRMYHSTALVLPDGSVFVGGSNTNAGYNFIGVPYPTELRLERYSPYYLNKIYDPRRPNIKSAPGAANYGAGFTVSFTVAQAPVGVLFRMYAPAFATHTYSMNQRSLILKSNPIVAANGVYSATVFAPPNVIIAPAGYYLLTVINQGTPSSSRWMKIG